MIYYLYELREAEWFIELFGKESFLYKLFNVFNYTSVRAGGACVMAFLLSVVFGDRVIRKLISLKIGQPIRTAEEVNKLHELHGAKAGAPDDGWRPHPRAIFVSVLVFARWDNLFVWVVMFVMLALGAVGFADDYKKVVRKNSAGISARTKLLAQLGIALVAGGVLAYSWQPAYADLTTGDYIRGFHVPFIKNPIIKDMGIFALVFFSVVIVGCSNAVNLTDGLDGLAIGCTITVSLAYAIFGYAASHYIWANEYLFVAFHPGAAELTVICLGLVGAGMGFLWFNCHPAKVFMGDTGSLAIGGMLATIAICCNQEVALVIVGGVFVMEAMSVILQVASFKLRGKRIFRMSPIHHHFELKGWKESQVIIRFWILSIIFALIGLATLKLR